MITKTRTMSKRTTAPKGETPNIRKQIRTLLDTIEQSWFEVSKLLADVYYGELYKTWGYNSFEEYAKTEVDMEYRSAMFRVQIGKTIKDLGIKEEQVKDLGWTKFKELTYLLKEEGMDKKTVEHLFNTVKDLSFRDTQEYVKQVRMEMDIKEEHKIKKTTMKFKFLQEQADTVERAIEEACAIIGTDNKNLALEYVALEWLMNHSEEPVAEIKPEKK